MDAELFGKKKSFGTVSEQGMMALLNIVLLLPLNFVFILSRLGLIEGKREKANSQRINGSLSRTV
jgi:hypothetical protein